MSEVIGSLELEFLINNPELLAQLQAAQENVQIATATMEQQTEQLAATATNSTNQQISAIQRLESELATYQELAAQAFDPLQAATYNREVELLTKSLDRLNSTAVAGSGGASPSIATSTNQQISAVKRLENEIAEYKRLAAEAFDPLRVAAYERNVEKLQAALARLNATAAAPASGAPAAKATATEVQSLGNTVESAVPKVGKFQAAIGKVTDVSNIGATIVSRLNRQIIGLGVSFLSYEIGAKAITALIDWIAKLDIFTGRLDQAKQNMIAFNEVMKSAADGAGKQAGDLKILYAAATDVNNAVDDRIRAAQELKKEYPDAFANSTALAIINGQEKKSFDELSESIIANAKARAAATKIEKLSGELFELDLQTAKVNAAKFAENQRAQQAYQKDLNYNKTSGANTDFGEDAETKQSKSILLAREKGNKESADRANALIEQTRKVKQGQLDFIMAVAGGSAKVAKAIEGGNDLIQNPLKNFDTIVKNASDKADLENLKKALQAKLDLLAPNDAQIAIYQDKLRQVEALEKQYSPKANDGQQAKSAGQSLLASQKSVLQDIDALKAKYATKDKTRDEQEQDAIKAAFTTQVNNINALNKKYDEYVAKYGAAAAKAAGLQKIDPSQLGTTETNALAGLAGTQSLDLTKQQINTQKTIFKEYEDYKLKAGTDAANQLYSNELKGFTSYIAYLKSLQPKETDLTSADPYTKARASALSDYLKIEIPAAQNQESQLQQKHLQDLIVGYQSYEQKRAAIIENANEDIALLIKAGNNEQAAQVSQNTQDSLDKLAESQVKSFASYKQLFDGVVTLTKEQTSAAIADLQQKLKDMLEAGNISLADYQKFTKQVSNASLALNNSLNPQKIQLIGEAFSQLASDISNVNGMLGALFGAAGNALSTLSKVGILQNELSELSKQTSLSAADQAAKFKDTVSLYMTAATGVINIIGDIANAAANRKAAETAYYDSIIASQAQYNLALDDQIRLQEQLNKNLFLKNYKADIADASQALAKENAQFAASLVALQQQGQAITGQHNAVDGKSVLSGAGSGAAAGAAIGAIAGGGVFSAATAGVGAAIGGVVGAIAGLFGGKKKVDTLTPIFQAWPGLLTKAKDGTDQFNEALAKNLIQNNLVNDSTKVLLQNTIDLNDARQAAIDQINQDITDLAGSLGDDLRSALVSAFEDGTDAAKAFGDSVSKVIDNIVSQFLFQDIFGSEFDKLSDSLKASFSITGDQNVTDDLTSFFKDAGPLVKQYQDALAAAKKAGAANGLDLFDPSSNAGSSAPATLSGQIKGITADEANILEGSIRGMQLAVVKNNDLTTTGNDTMVSQLTEMRSQTLMQMQIVANTKKVADNSDVMKQSLDNIDKNTSGSLASQLRAAGKYGY